MFLNRLTEEEKSIFLKLAIAVIQADGKLEDKEKGFIADYCREMGIESYDVNEKVEYQELAEKIGKNSSDSVKRIFLLELTALANVDGEFVKSEKSLIMTFAKKFGYGEDSLDNCLKVLDEYKVVSEKLMSLIQEGQ